MIKTISFYFLLTISKLLQRKYVSNLISIIVIMFFITHKIYFKVHTGLMEYVLSVFIFSMIACTVLDIIKYFTIFLIQSFYISELIDYTKQHKKIVHKISEKPVSKLSLVIVYKNSSGSPVRIEDCVYIKGTFYNQYDFEIDDKDIYSWCYTADLIKLIDRLSK